MRITDGLKLGIAACLSSCEVLAQAPKPLVSVARVVQSMAPKLGGAEADRLAPEPSLVIGRDSGEANQFSRIRGAVRLSSGMIVVADGASSQIRFFDSAGRAKRVVGGRGSGPGEYVQTSRLGVTVGDTLVVVSAPGVVTWLAPDGRFLERSTGGGPLRVVMGVLPAKQVVTGSFLPTNDHPKGSRWVDSVQIDVRGADGRLIRTVDRLPGAALIRAEYPRPEWFGPEAVYCAGTDAYYYGFGTEYRIHRYEAKSNAQTIISRAWVPKRVTSAETEVFVQEWASRWIKTSDPAREARIEELRRDPYSTTLPAFSQFLSDGAARLWVRSARSIDAAIVGRLGTMPLRGSTWSVFDSSGRWVEDVEMPPKFLATDIGADYVLGVATDEDDVERVVLYALQRARRP